MTFFEFFIEPITCYPFMLRALLGCIGLSMAAGPIGVLLILKRMSLTGEALSHAILPGIALSSLLFGFWMPGFMMAAIVVGVFIVVAARFLTAHTGLSIEATFSGLYLWSTAIGVIILSLSKGNVNILHLLFGNVLAIDQSALQWIGVMGSLILLFLVIAYKPIIYESFDPIYMHLMRAPRHYYHVLFWIAFVVLLVAAVITMGTLMALGLVIIPALTARIMVPNLLWMFFWSIILGSVASYVGLLSSYHFDWPSGPTIIVSMSLLFALVCAYQLSLKQFGWK